MKKKIFDLSYVLFGTIFLLIFIVPLLYKNYLFIGLNVLIIGIVSLIVFFARKKIKFKLKDRPIYFYLIILVVLCLVIRLICALYFNDITQVSDFLRAYNNSMIQDFSDSYYRNAVHWLLYPKVLFYLFSIFGKSQLTLSIFNIIISCLVVMLLYFIVYKITKNKRVSFFSTLLYVFLPSSILYIGFASPEYVAVLFYCLCVLLIIILLQNKNKIKLNKLIYLSLLIGIVLSISNFFKGISIILFIAIVIVFVVDFFKNTFNKTAFIKSFMSLLLILATYLSVNFLIYSYCDMVVGSKVTRNGMGAYLLVGLSSTNDGTYNEKIYKEHNDYFVKYNYDFDKVNEIILSKVMNDIKSNYTYYPKLFINKINIAFKNDMAIANWLYYANGEKQDKLFNVLYVISDYYYMIVLIFLFVGLYNIFKRLMKLENVFIYLFILGFVCTMLLGEVQGRYKYIIMPFVVILSGINMYDFYKIKFKKENNKIDK